MVAVRSLSVHGLAAHAPAAWQELPPNRWTDWNSGVASMPAGHMHQCTWWAEPLARYGVRTRVLAARADSGFAAGALFRVIPLPLPRLTLLEGLDGPVVRPGEPFDAPGFAAAVQELAREERALAVLFKGGHDAAVKAALQESLAVGRGRVKAAPGNALAVIPLADRPLAEIESGYQERTQRAISSATQRGSALATLTTPEELEEAHAAWRTSTGRMGCADVRPWPALAPMLAHATANGLGTVFGTRHDGRIVAAIFVSHLGDTAHCVYGGFRDEAEALSPTHLLHATAIADAHRRGRRRYSFGTLLDGTEPNRTDIDAFKLSFGARAERALDTLAWERIPWLYGCVRHLFRAGAGRSLARLWRQRLIARASASQP